MSYDLTRIDLPALFAPVCRATEALARLDECIARSTIREGFLERQDFADAVASMWVDGELVHVEDLVLHDARRDARTPTHELTIAHSVLRSRRQIASHPADWAMSRTGLSRLRGEVHDAKGQSLARPASPTFDQSGSDDDVASDECGDEFAEIDALLTRSSALIEETLGNRGPPNVTTDRDTLIYDADWDEDARLEEWFAVLRSTEGLPPLLRMAIALDAWNQLQVLQHRVELGRQLAAALLRQEGVARTHLPTLNVGLKTIKIDRRRSPSRMTRLLAIVESVEEAATTGLKEHDRLLAARAQLERRTANRRGHSRLPQLVDLVIARPVVSASLIAQELDITPQGALILTKELNLREMTGRGRYRAWGIL
ncbi:HTH DNA binding domain-containing protein [Ensifer adhaerens]|nr:HTH DNA binding domain-containing protein [Ensifer adhaerens]